MAERFCEMTELTGRVALRNFLGSFVK